MSKWRKVPVRAETYEMLDAIGAWIERAPTFVADRILSIAAKKILKITTGVHTPPLPPNVTFDDEVASAHGLHGRHTGDEAKK